MSTRRAKASGQVIDAHALLVGRRGRVRVADRSDLGLARDRIIICFSMKLAGRMNRRNLARRLLIYFMPASPRRLACWHRAMHHEDGNWRVKVAMAYGVSLVMHPISTVAAHVILVAWIVELLRGTMS